MTEAQRLQLGYAGLALSLALLAASVYPPLAGLVLLAPLVAVGASVLLALSDDEVPKWAGIAFLVYALITVIAFLAATPATIRFQSRNFFANPQPSEAAQLAFDYVVLALPLMITATALVASWERENSARVLLAGALVGIVAVAVLTVALAPDRAIDVTDPQDVARAQAEASSQASLLRLLLGISLASGVAGAAWSAWRPDEYH